MSALEASRVLEAVDPPEPTSAPVARVGHPLSRLALRLAIVYFGLYDLPELLPFFGPASRAYTQVWHALVPWVGAHGLHLAQPITIFPNGSGDTTYNYVELLCFAAIALVVASIWLVIDRRRDNDALLHGTLRLILRYVLAVTMVGYGVDKLFKLQFPYPSLDGLYETYGASSPMHLLWTFMGYSTAYTVFAGAAETLGAVLLFFRRTALLGALVVAAVMSNVVMLNFCYDVPVKLFSSHLLLMAGILILPDLGRLANLLVLQRATAPVAIAPYFRRTWLNRAGLALKAVLIGSLAWSGVKSSLDAQRQYGDHAARPPLYGAYEVTSFRDGEKTLPPLTTDHWRWQRLIVNAYGNASVTRMDGTTVYYRLKVDPARHALTLGRYDSKLSDPLSYRRPTADSLELTGRFENSPILVTLERRDPQQLTLVKRGFHWINEYPDNE